MYKKLIRYNNWYIPTMLRRLIIGSWFSLGEGKIVNSNKKTYKLLNLHNSEKYIDYNSKDIITYISKVGYN